MSDALEFIETPDLNGFELHPDLPALDLFSQRRWLDVIGRTFSARAVYVLALRDGSVVGLTPLSRVASLGRMRMVGSYQTCYSRSLHRTPGTDPGAMLAHILETYGGGRGRSVVLPSDELLESPTRPITGFSFFTLDVGDEALVQFAAGASKRMRSYIRGAEAAELDVAVGGAELLDRFYPLYSRNMQELGSPPKPKAFFRAVLTGLASDAWLILVAAEGHDSSGMLVLRPSAAELFTPIIATPRKHAAQHTTHRLYLEGVRLCQGLGASRFNLGRSIADSGHAELKRRLGAREVPLYYYTSDGEAHRREIDPARTRMRHLVDAWRLMPLWMSELGGRLITRHLM